MSIGRDIQRDMRLRRAPEVVARIAELRALESRIAFESHMPGNRYRTEVADPRPMKPYADSPNLRPIQW